MKRLTSNDLDMLHAEATLWNVVTLLGNLHIFTGTFRDQLSDLRVAAVVLAENIGKHNKRYGGDE